jgi:alpha-1,6-mannosyltransferase
MTAASLPLAPAANRRALAALVTAGSVMLAFAASAPWVVRTAGYGVFVPLLAASGLITIYATRRSADLPTAQALAIVLGFAVAMRLVLVTVDPLLSTDVYRYVWDGRVQAAGINPYRYVPADPALATLRDGAIYPHISRADYAVTAYPPLAEMLFLAATRIGESLTTMRLTLVACEIATVAAIIALLRRLCLPEQNVVAYAWHPLALFEIANNGHVEALMVALIMVGVWLLVSARRVLGAAVVAAAVVVKPYAVLALPAFWRPREHLLDWRVPLVIAAVVVACYLPYLGAGRDVLGFLGSGYLAEEGLTSGEGIWLVALLFTSAGKVPAIAAVYVVISAAIMIMLGLRVALRRAPSPQQTVADVALLLTVGLFLMSPNYPWYFLALVPLLPMLSPREGSAPVWALTLFAFLLYRPLVLPANELTWKTLATTPFLIAVAATRWRSSPKGGR